jgi:hypothetical protein
MGYRVRVRNESRWMLLEESILWEGVYLCVGVGKRGRHTSLAPLRNQQHQFNTSLPFLGIRTAASTATSVDKQRSSHMQHEERLQNTSTSHTAVPYPATCSPGRTSPQPAATRQAYFAAPPCQPPRANHRHRFYFGSSMLARLPLSTWLAPKRRLSNTS